MEIIDKPISSRPSWNNEMLEELAQIVGKMVNGWCDNETELEDCINTAKKILKHNSDDGYELAKDFESEGFSPDSELVEILNYVSYEKNTIINNCIRKWVVDNSLKLEFVVGQNVIVKLNYKGDKVCEIMKLIPEEMKYGIWYDGIGYQKGKGCIIVNSENVKDLVVGEDMICPITKLHCEDECCPVGSICNLGENDISFCE